MIIKHVQICPQEAVAHFPKEVGQVLSVIGFDEAFVTDESQICDFFSSFGPTGGDAEDGMDEATVLKNLSALANREVFARDRLWEIARDIHLSATVSSIH